jgi:hypothetical protein
MIVLNRDSLSETLDAVNQAIFDGQPITSVEREEVANWIAGLQGGPRSYFGLFAPVDHDHAGSVRVFSGEPIKSKVGITHILGEEAGRALILLKSREPAVKAALDRATAGILERMTQEESHGKVCGMYCCGTCSVAYWRHVSAGGLDRHEERLNAGMKELRYWRAGEGRWRRFPFYYTLLALGDMDIKPAVDEMRYAAPALERYLKLPRIKGEYARRRRLLFERILAKC